MGFPESTVRWQRAVLAALLVLSGVVVLPSAVEPFMLPKATFLALGALIIAALASARVAWQRQITFPVSPVMASVGVLAAALCLTTLMSKGPWTSLVGWYGRYTGLVPYLCLLLVFVTVVRHADSGLFDLLRRTALVTLGLVVAYGLVQAAGADPVAWVGQTHGTTFSFLGNVDFGAAWAGAVVALALATAVRREEPTPWRWYSGLLVPSSLLYAVLTGTSQGPVVAMIALLWTSTVLAATPGSALRRVASQQPRRAWALLGVAVAATVVGLVSALPYLRAQLAQAFVERPQFWAVALEIFGDHPLLGTGLDTYGRYFSEYRPASHALLVGAAGADAPHSVPLGMFSNGGLVLGLSYLAVVALIGVTLIKGALRTTGKERSVIAGFGGVWLGYQAQSLVSYDVPPLAMLHWVSAGVIVAVAAPPRWRKLDLPGKAPQRTKARGRQHGPLVVPASTRVVQGGIVVATLVAVWFALYPLRADLLAASAAPLGKSGQLDAAIERLDRAAGMNPAEPSYPLLAAQAGQAAGRHGAAYEYAVEAAERDPGDVQAALFAAWQAQQIGDMAVAEWWYREAAERDPKHPAVLADVAAFFVAQQRYDDAEPYLRRAVEIDPGHAKARELLAAMESQ